MISVVKPLIFRSCLSTTVSLRHLGDENSDNWVIDYFVKLCKKRTGTDVPTNLSRCEVAKFEKLNMDIFHKTRKPVEQVPKDANIKKEDIDEVRGSYSLICTILTRWL